MAEEAKDPFRSVPRAIVGSVVAAAVLGIAVRSRAHRFDRPTSVGVGLSGSPVAEILRDQFGPVLERSGAGCGSRSRSLPPPWSPWPRRSRIVFAMARDQRFPASRALPQGQSPHPDPDPGHVCSSWSLGIVLMAVVPRRALLAADPGGRHLRVRRLYGLTIVLYLAVRSRLDPPPGSLGPRPVGDARGRRRVALGRRRLGRRHRDLTIPTVDPC